MSQVSSNQRGYTIVELMIASVVFSIILLGASAAIIQIGRMYYKGVISSRTQNVTRIAMDEISRSIQFSGDDITILDDPFIAPTGPLSIEKGVFCIGDTRYTFLLNAQVSSDSTQNNDYALNHKTYHAFWKDQVSDPNTECQRVGSPSLTIENPSSGGQELLDEHMRLLGVDITTQDDLWTISLSVAYGDDDVFENSDATTGRCRGIVTGSQWCAVSKLNTSVYKRIQGE